MSRAGRRARTVVGALAAMLMLASCSDYGGDLSGASAAGGEGDTLVVSETAGTPSAFLTYGVREGHFAEQGLDLEVRPSAGGASVIPALLSGDIDVAGSNVVSAVLAQGRRMPIQMIAAGTSTADEAELDFAAIMTSEGSPVSEPADLRGRSIAVNTLQNINDVTIQSVLDQHGLGIDDVNFLEMPLPDMPAAIARGDADAGLLIEPFVTIGRAQGLQDVARPYTATRPGLQIGTYLMTAERVADEPELAEAFRAGVSATAEAIAADPDAFREALPEISELDPELAARMNLPVWHGSTDRESIETIHSIMREIGLTDADLRYDEDVLG